MPSQVAGRRVRWLAAAVLLAAGGLLGAILGVDAGDSSVPIPAIAADNDAQGTGTGTQDASERDDSASTDQTALTPTREDPGNDLAAAQPIGDPQRIEIPAIGVDAEIVPVGLKDDGAMEVPDFGLAGWYTEGPRPGEEGPSTVVAHVDSRSGPDVFARLRELDPGDEVRVHGDDGTVTYVVETSESAPKDELPTERIWGWTPEPTLRLLTCDGLFDRSSGHYEDNLIVYLTLADS